MKRLTLSAAEALALVATALGMLHHFDHVLRFDHSGWPFRPEVNTFTYTLLIYPLIVVLFAARGRPLLRVVLAFLLFMLPTLAHTLIETPAHQFDTWAHRPDVNLLSTSSPAFGSTAALLTVALSSATFLMFVAFWREYRARGRAAV